eukprot:11855017-Alexandrium_andersonii.AAC.1
MSQHEGNVLPAGTTPLGGLPRAEGRFHDRCDGRHRGGLDQPAQCRRQHQRALLFDQPAVAFLGNPHQQLNILPKDGNDGCVPD